MTSDPPDPGRRDTYVEEKLVEEIAEEILDRCKDTPLLGGKEASEYIQRGKALHLARTIVREVLSRGESLDVVDLDSLIDCDLDYYEQKRIILDWVNRHLHKPLDYFTYYYRHTSKIDEELLDLSYELYVIQSQIDSLERDIERLLEETGVVPPQLLESLEEMKKEAEEIREKIRQLEEKKAMYAERARRRKEKVKQAEAVKPIEETVKETVKERVKKKVKPTLPAFEEKKPQPPKPMTLEEMIEAVKKKLLSLDVPEPLVNDIFQDEGVVSMLRAEKKRCEQEATSDEKCIERILKNIHDFLYLTGTERYQILDYNELMKRYPHAFFSTPGSPREVMSPGHVYMEIFNYADLLKRMNYKVVYEPPSFRMKNVSFLFFDLNLEVVFDKKEEKVVITSHDVIMYASDHDKKEFYYYWYTPNPWLRKPRLPPPPYLRVYRLPWERWP